MPTLTQVTEAFTFVGAVLGTIAFLQNFIAPVVQYNKLKLQELRKKIDDIDFENIMVSLWHSHTISPDSMAKLQSFMHDIDRDSMDIKFKTFFFNRYDQSFKNIVQLYAEWRKLVQVPWWEPTNIGWVLNKNVFYEKSNETGNQDDIKKADEDYPKHLEKAYDLVVEMRKEFKKILIMADREYYEFFLPWKWFK